MANAAAVTMDELLASATDGVAQLVSGETINGTVLSVKKHEVLLDLGRTWCWYGTTTRSRFWTKTRRG